MGGGGSFALFISKWSLRARLLALGVVLSVSPLIVTAVVVYKEGQGMRSKASKECKRLAYSDLDHIAEGAYSTIEAQQELLSDKVSKDLEVAKKLVEIGGELSLCSEKSLTWRAKNQFTGELKEVELPRMLLGDESLGKISSFSEVAPLVDEVKDLVGGTCTVFQRMNEAGDMLRVSTNVKKQDGKRAIGTYIPYRNPDGSPNRVVSTVLRGETYRGRAYVVNAWYVTAYAPFRNESGRIIGLIYTGVKEESAESLRKAIMSTVVGKTGYIWVIDSRGHYIISKDGKRDGEDISQAQDANGSYFIQEICRKAKELDSDEIAEQRYPWKNSSEEEARMKIARIKYFPQWDWIIGASAYEDEFFDAVAAIEASTSRSFLWIGVICILSSLLATVLWSVLSRGLSSRIELVGENVKTAGVEV